jgi:hypothetical protein
VDRLRHVWQLRWTPYVAAFDLYSAAALVFFGWPLADLSHRCLCDSSPDPEAYMWELAWWPHAIGAGINPFVTHAIWAPDAYNLASVASIPGASLLAFPLTSLVGPLGTYDLLALLSPVLSGMAAFALCSYVADAVGPALVGGALFGFSSYEVGQLTEHLNLTLVFLVPLAVLLVLRLIDDRISRRRFVALLAVVLALQLLLSSEIAATASGVALIAIAVAYFTAGEDLRIRLRVTVRSILIAGVTAAIVTSPFLYYTFKGGLSSHTSPYVSADALAWFIPTRLMRLGGHYFGAVSTQFTTYPVENGAYLPLPLLALAALGLFKIRRRSGGIAIAAVAAIAVVIASGPYLQIAGKRTIPLPWKLLQNLPVFESIAPVRFTLYVSLAVAVLVTLALSRGTWRAGPLWRWGLAVIGLVLLIPNTSTNAWRDRPSDPRFFEAAVYKRLIARNEVVLTLPSPRLVGSGANLWQAQARMYFRVAEGYLGPILPTDYLGDPVLNALLTNQTASVTPAQLRSFLLRHRVQAVVLDASQPASWPALLARTGLRPESEAGVLLYEVRDPPSRAAPR